MEISAITQANVGLQRSQAPVDDVQNKRQKQQDKVASSENIESKKVQAEELLDKIKALSEDGAYSVRFEFNETVKQFVVRVVDPENDEVIRQLPPEEILGMKAFMREFRGQLVDSES